MRARVALPTATAAILLLLGPVSAAGRRPSLRLKATPVVAIPDTAVLFVATLEGDAAGEEWYCPVVAWDWGDGSVTTHEGECPPYAAGVTPIERRFTADHTYRDQGRRTVRVTLKKGEKVLATASERLVIGRRDERSLKVSPPTD